MGSCGLSGTVCPFGPSWTLDYRGDTNIGWDRDQYSRTSTSVGTCTVLADWIDQDTREWKEDVVRAALDESEAQWVMTVPIPIQTRYDELRWPFDRKGKVTARSAYHFLRSQDSRLLFSNDSMIPNVDSVLPLWSAIWKSSVVPKIKTFSWKLASKALAVRDCLSRRGMQVQVSCHLCSTPETIEHLILDCDWAKVVWVDLIGLVDVRDGCSSVNQWLIRRMSDQSGSRAGFDWRWQTILTACWSICKGRCAMVFEGLRPNPYQVVNQVRSLVREQAILAQQQMQ